MSDFTTPVPNDSEQPEPDLRVVSPSRSDVTISAASEGVGGPLGNRYAYAASFWGPLPVLVVFSFLGFVVGLASKLPCVANGWADPGRYTHLCYSDIPPLFSLRGFSNYVFPYIQAPLPGQDQFEYPVGTGLFVAFANYLTPRIGDTTTWFFYVNAILLFIALIVLVLATALTVKRRPWDAAMVALAPGTILCATINWDLFAVALTAVAMLLWARRYPAWAGVVLGVAAATKFYPLLLIGPILLLCLRAGQLVAFGRFFGGLVLGWLALNVPFMFINFDGWARFYVFSSERGEDFGSIWLVLTKAGAGVPPTALNNLAIAILVVCCVGIAWLILGAPRRPRLAGMAFLVVAAFLLTNKVYSPQYVLWLIPLAVMARPRWRDFLIWQGGEVIYYVAIWWYLAGLAEDSKGLPVGWYGVAIFIRIAATVFFAERIIRDALLPADDPIRSDGFVEDEDDPGGGVLDGSPDAWSLRKKDQTDAAPSI